MRAGRVSLSVIPKIYAYANNNNRIFMVKNRSAANTIYIQFGADGGNQRDAWPLGAGETFVLDPAAPRANIWLSSDAADIDNVVLLG